MDTKLCQTDEFSFTKILHYFRYCIHCIHSLFLLQRNEDWQMDSCYFDWKKIDTKEARSEVLNQYFYNAKSREGVQAMTFELFI